jgi:hypothetical protein
VLDKLCDSDENPVLVNRIDELGELEKDGDEEDE